MSNDLFEEQNVTDTSEFERKKWKKLIFRAILADFRILKRIMKLGRGDATYGFITPKTVPTTF